MLRDAYLKMYQEVSDDRGHSQCQTAYTSPSADGQMSPLHLSTLRNYPDSGTQWDQSVVTWNHQPPVFEDIVDNYSTAGNGTCPSDYVATVITDSVGKWIDRERPELNNGFSLSAERPATYNGRRRISTSDSTRPPHVDVTYELPPQVIDTDMCNAQGNPELFNGYQWLTGTSTTLRAQLSDPDSNPAQVAASFLVQDTTTGATVISGDAAGTVGSGGWLSFPIYVTDGHSYTWQVRGHYNNGYGDVYGDFTQPESFYVDGQPPSVPSITSSDVRVNDWITASTPTSAGFSFSATDNSGINDYLVSRDGQPAELSGPTYCGRSCRPTTTR